MHSFRAALRSLRRARAFSVLVLSILGIGIGASTAIFSAVNEVMLRPLGFRDPGRLAMLWESHAERGWDRVHVAPANALDWRDRVPSFEDVALVNETSQSLTLVIGTAAQPITVGRVSGNALAMLGARTVLGRTFTLEESWSDGPPLVVLSHAAWLRYFNGDSAVIGRSVRLDGVPFAVIGVLNPSFRYVINDAEAWLTFRWSAATRSGVWFRRAHVVRAIARLKPGASIGQASRELAAVADRLEAEYPETNRGMKAGLTPLQTFLIGDRRTSLLLLLGAVAVLQLLVCANVANLFEARSLGRRQELAVRTALGAGRQVIMRQVLLESALLAAGGALLGLLVGGIGLRLIDGLRPENLPDLVFRLDWRVLSFTLGVSILSALLFGIRPAFSASQFDVTRSLRDDSRTVGSAGRRRGFLAHSLIACEIALSVLLVSAAGLMLRSIAELRRVDSGVKMDRVLTFEVRPLAHAYRDDSERRELALRLLERFQEAPGVDVAGAGRLLPFMGLGWSSDFILEGWPAGEFGVEVRHREATAGYFQALGVPLREGALVPDRLVSGTSPAVLVNQAFAERYARGQSLVGRRIAFVRAADTTTVWHAIAGVVGNERMQLTSDAQPEVIGHLASDTPGLLRFVVKGRSSASALVAPIRAAIASIDPELPMLRPRPLQAVAVEALAADRYLMILLGVFAALATALAAVGVYGVASQVARSRTREAGIRLALGATPAQVTVVLTKRVLAYVGVGAVAGIGGVLVTGRAIEKLLFRVEPTDPVALGGVIALHAVVALVATLQPAVRAATRDASSVMSAT